MFRNVSVFPTLEDNIQYMNKVLPIKESFDLIFLDPPYGGALLNRALEEICRIDILRQGGIILCESAAEDQLISLMPPYQVNKTYRYGRICLTVVSKGTV